MAPPKRFPTLGKVWGPVIRRLVDDGVAEAYSDVWFRLHYGGRRNRAAALPWLRLAAKTLPNARYQMGRAIRDDVRLPRAARIRRSAVWFRRAAAAGVNFAWRELAKPLLTSPRTPGRLAKARRWFETGLRAGDGDAGFHLAVDIETFAGDLKEVERWLLRSVIVDEDDGKQHFTLEQVRRAKPFLKRWMAHPPDTWRLLAEAGDLEAQTSLAYAHRFGRGVTYDAPAARRWFERAARAGAMEARLALALMRWDAKAHVKPEHAAFWSVLAAKSGDPTALWAAGSLDARLDDGDARRAARSWRAAAMKGHAGAAYELGQNLMTGSWLPGNPREGVRWIRAAAQGGVPEARIWYAEMLDDGKRVPRDRRAATRWLMLAAQAGNPDAQLKLGVRFHEGVGVRRDDRECVRWYRRAAAQGEPHAMSNLGLCYKRGSGVRRNVTRALAWFRRAVEVGENGRAAFHLSRAYSFGWSGRKDAILEAHWLRRGAALMDPDCLCALGVLYHNGKRVPMDRPFAVALYRAAAMLGDGWATYLLGLSYRDGEGVRKNRRHARAWFRRATGLGVRQAARAERAMSRTPA